MSYRTIPLRRIFRVVNGGTPTSDASNWGGEVPWATPADFTGQFSKLTRTQRTLTTQGVRNGSATAPAGALLVSTRAPIGYVTVIGTETAFNQGCRALVPQGDVDTRFFGYQLEGSRGHLQREGAGTTFPELSSDKLASLPVQAPPLEEQRRIADFLDAEVARIRKLSRVQNRLAVTLDERFNVLRDQLVDSLIRDEGVIPLRRLTTRIDQGASPQCDAIPRKTREDWAVLKVSSVKRGVFDANENKLLPLDTAPIKEHEVNAGDLLITRANTPDLVGDTAVVPRGTSRLLLPDLIYRATTTSDTDPYFLAQVALGTRIRSLVQAEARGSSRSMVKLRAEDIKKWPIPRASAKRQNDFTEEIKRHTEKTNRMQRAISGQLALLTERRQALITAAVTGQFDVSTASGRNVTD